MVIGPHRGHRQSRGWSSRSRRRAESALTLICNLVMLFVIFGDEGDDGVITVSAKPHSPERMKHAQYRRPSQPRGLPERRPSGG